MSYNKLIHDYLDTGLAQPQEDALFHALASNQSLRGEFNQQLSIMKIAANDMNSISPPIETTNAVFSSLGFTIPSSNYTTEAIVNESRRKPGASLFASASGVGILNIFKDNFNTLASIGMAAIISTLLFMTFQDNLPNKVENNLGITLAKNYSNGPVISNLPMISSIEKSDKPVNHKTINTSRKVQSMNNSIEANIDRNSIKEEFKNNIAVNEPSNKSYEDKYKNLEINKNSYAIVKVNRISNNSPSIGQFFIPTYQNDENSGFSLEMRGANNSAGNTLVNDMLIGVNFEFYDNWYAVGMIGNEHYLVRVANPLSAGEQVKYSNESMVSFMVGLRYAPNDLILDGILVPYVQANGGGISNGFAGGIESGLMFNINKNYSLLVGYGKQFAKYNFEGNLYNTSKSGLNFGMRYSF